MTNIALMLIVSVLLSGCSTTFKIETPEYTAKYKSPFFERKQFDKLNITRLDDGSVEVVITAYEKDTNVEALQEVNGIVSSAVEGAVKGAMKGV